MIRVRFPNGQCITYNTGWYVENLSDKTGRRILTVKGGDLVAWVPNDCVIEWVKACSVENPLDGNALERAAAALENMTNPTTYEQDRLLERMKRRLASFNLKTRRWR